MSGQNGGKEDCMITVGRQIDILISEGMRKGSISMRKLTQGICTRDALYKFINGGIAADPRFLKILIQRLGKSQNKLEYIASKEFIDLVDLQLSFDDSIDWRDGAQALDLMEEIEAFSALDDYKSVKQMYGCRNKAAYEYYIKCDPAQALDYIESAISITVPRFKAEMMPEYILSSVELENILFACLMRLETGKAKAEHNRQLVDSVLSYIEKSITDQEEQAYIMPKAQWLSGLLYLKAGEKENAVSECSKGLELLRKNGMLQMSLPLLSIIIEHGQGLALPDPFEDYAEYRTLIETLTKKYLCTGPRYDSLFFDADRAMYHYEAEVYKGQRLIKDLTQDGIADIAETSSDIISKYEKGKRSPRKSNYSKLMKALEIDYAKQGTFLISESFQLLEAEREINNLLIFEKYDLAEKKLDELSKKIDTGFWSNRLLLTEHRNHIGLLKGTLEPETILKEDLSLLEEVYPIGKLDVKRPPFLVESGLVAQVYACYSNMGRKEEAKELCDKVVATFENSYVPKTLQQRTYTSHISNQTRYCNDGSIVQKAVAQRLVCRNCNGLDMILSSHATRIYRTDVDLSKENAYLSLTAAKLHRGPNVMRIQTFIDKWFTSNLP